ncbi:MAG: chromosomal replication initiator protein DnaA [Bacteroidaceae bacterium]|nr:chromosomal replication initiator protein DnaA [Bacteroidaceae bacterium]
MASSKVQWQRCMELFRNHLNEQQYSTWFAPLRFKSYDAETQELTIFIPSQFFYEYLEANFRRLLYMVLYHVFGQGTRLLYQVAVIRNEKVDVPSQGPRIDVNTNIEDEDVRVIPKVIRNVVRKDDLDPRLNIEQTFDNFIEGVSNRLARSVGQAVAEDPDRKTFNPLFIYGPSGCGKTHLANAIGVRLKRLHPDKRVLYVAAHEFQVTFVQARIDNKINDFINFYQGIDCLILDDVQEFSGKTGTLEAFFHIFNHLHLNGRQIIMTSDRPPVELKDMEERMLTRFKWGMLAELESPDGQLRRDILHMLMRRDGLLIPDDVIDYIAANIQDNIRELEGVVHSLLAYSVMGNNSEINLDFARRIVKANTKRTHRKVTEEDIVECTCRHYKLTQEEIIGACRRADYVQGRHVAMYLIQKHTGNTVKHIGSVFGGRTHTTVLHGIQQIEKRLKTDSAFRKELRDIEKTF